MLKLADMDIHILYILAVCTSHNRRNREHKKWMYVAVCGGGRKVMQVNRIFHYRLLGLQCMSCNEDESYNLEAASRSFVPQYTHVIQPAPLDESTHTHTDIFTWRIS